MITTENLRFETLNNTFKIDVSKGKTGITKNVSTLNSIVYSCILNRIQMKRETLINLHLSPRTDEINLLLPVIFTKLQAKRKSNFFMTLKQHEAIEDGINANDGKFFADGKKSREKLHFSCETPVLKEGALK